LNTVNTVLVEVVVNQTPVTVILQLRYWCDYPPCTVPIINSVGWGENA